MRLLLFSLCLVNMLHAQERSYLQCGLLIDGISDEIQKEMTIVVENNIIVDIQKGYQGKKGDKIIDLRQKTVLPGLIDMHVHIESLYDKNFYSERFTLNEADIAFRAAVYAKTTLEAGFTTVRDLGGTGVNVSLRNAIAQGVAVGPRIYAAAKSIASTGGHADPTNGAKKGVFDFPGPEAGVADGADECRKAVRQQIKNGADVIKITATGGVLSVARDGRSPQFSEEEMRAIIETAKDMGIKVTAHAHGDEGIRRAVEAGIASIEHGTFMSEASMDLMIKQGTYLIPTLTAGRAVADSAKIPGFYPPIITPKALATGPQIQETFSKAFKKGVKIAFGTDAGVFPHGKNALEFQYMVEGGMTPMEAIKAATVNAADLLGERDKLGSIEVGKLADIIAVAKNPLEDVKVLMNIDFIMKDGKVYK